MTEGDICKSILFFSVPLILGNLLQQMYNAVDSIIVGNYVGRDALAAVGSSTSLIYLLIAFSQGAAVGAGVVVSQHLGARDKKGVHSSVHTALAISVMLGLILTAGGILFSRPLLVWMNTPTEILQEAVTYLQIYSGGMVFNVVYNMAAGIMNAAGNSKRSLRYLAAASIVNVVLDLLLIAGFQMGGCRGRDRNKYQLGRLLRIGNAVSDGRPRTVSGKLERDQNSEASCSTDHSNWSAYRISKYGYFSFQHVGPVQR